MEKTPPERECSYTPVQIQTGLVAVTDQGTALERQISACWATGRSLAQSASQGAD